MSTAQRLLKNTFFLYTKIVIVAILSLLTTRIVLSALGVVDFGVFSIIGGTIAMLSFLNSSMVTVTQRYMNFYEGERNIEKQKEVYNVGVILHLFLSFIVVAILSLSAPFFFDGILNIPEDRIFPAKIIYCCFILNVFFTISSVPYDATINAHENMLYYSIVGVGEAVLKFLVALTIMFVGENKLVIYGILLSLVPFVKFIALLFYCLNKYDECKFNPRKYWNLSLLKEEMSFAGWNLLTSSSILITRSGMGVILNHFFGVVVNAAQGIANQVSGFTTTFSGNALRALNPVIVKSEGAKDRKRLLYTSLLGCRVTFFIFGFFAIPLIIAMPIVLKMWLTNVPEWAVVFCRLQLVYSLSEQLLNGIAKSIYAHGSIKHYTIRKGFVNLMPLLLSYHLFANGYPPSTCYITLLLCWFFLGGILIIYYAHKLVNLSYVLYFKDVVGPSITIILLSMLTYLALSSISENEVIRILSLSGTIIIYTYLGWKLSFHVSERNAIYKIIYSQIKKNKTHVSIS